MKPSDRVRKAVADDMVKLTEAGATSIPDSWLVSTKLDEIIRILDEKYVPDVTASIEALTHVVDVIDSRQPRERATILALLHERYNSAGDRR